MADILPRRVRENIDRFTGRTWLLPRILEWWDHSDERLLLLTGGPGTGKSMILAWLSGCGPQPQDSSAQAGLTRVRSLVKAAHFCQASSRNISPQAFAENIANQLSGSVKGFADALVATLQERVQITATQTVETVAPGGNVTGVSIGRLDLGALSDELSFDRAFTQPLKKLYDSDHTGPILAVIDALDEALGYTGGKTLPALLATLVDLPARMRILATTRDDPRVLKLFRDTKPFDLVKDAPPDVDDVRVYATRRLTPLNAMEDTKHGEFADRLSKQAGGVFLYASIVLDELLARANVDLPNLDSLSLPKGLSGLYHEFLNRELGKDEQLWFDVYEPVLGLISVGLGEGLTSGLLRAITGDDVRATVRASKQYLSGELPEGPFLPFHKSFTDFLLEDKDNVDYHVDAASMHQRIADYYLTRYRDKTDWRAIDPYALRYLTNHLFEARLDKDVISLATSPFLLAKISRFHNYRAVTNDLMLGLQSAERARDLVAFLRLALMVVGIRIRAGKIKDEGTLYALIGEVDRAVDLALMIQTEWRRTVALRTIVAALALEHVDQALEVVAQIDDLRGKIESLVLVLKADLRMNAPTSAIRTSLNHIDELLVNTNEWPYWQTALLMEIADALATNNVAEAEVTTRKGLARARYEGDAQHRYESLRRVAHFLAATGATDATAVYEEALNALESVSRGKWRLEQYGDTIDELAHCDLTIAIARSRQVNEPGSRVVGLARVAVHASLTDIKAAEELIAEAEVQVHYIGLGKAEGEEWQRLARNAITLAREHIQAIQSGRPLPVPKQVPHSTLQLWELPPVQDISEVEYGKRVYAGKAGTLDSSELYSLVRLCAARGDAHVARELVQAAVRRSSSSSVEEWSPDARAVLVRPIADCNLSSALEMAQTCHEPAYSSIMATVIEVAAEKDLPYAIRLMRESPPKIAEYRARAIAALLHAAAEIGDTTMVRKYEKELRNCGSPLALMDLKCDGIARASGTVYRHDRELATQMMKWVLGEMYGDPEVIGAALAVMGESSIELFIKAVHEYEKKSGDVRAMGIAAAARGVAPFAPEESLRVLPLLSWAHADLQSTVLSAAARALAPFDRQRAAKLLDDATNKIQFFQRWWGPIESILRVAGDCVTWNDPQCISLIIQAVDLARSYSNPVILGRTLARAAAVLLVCQEGERAVSFLCESCECLATPKADVTQLEEIVKACEVGPPTLASDIGPRAIRGVIVSSTPSPDSSGIYDWLDWILRLLLHAAGTQRLQMATDLWAELDHAQALVEGVFIG